MPGTKQDWLVRLGHESIQRDWKKQSIGWNKSGLSRFCLQTLNNLNSSSCDQTTCLTLTSKHRLSIHMINNRISIHIINRIMLHNVAPFQLLNHHWEIPLLYICHTTKPLFCITATGHCVEALQSRWCFDQKIQHTWRYSGSRGLLSWISLQPVDRLVPGSKRFFKMDQNGTLHTNTMRTHYYLPIHSLLWMRGNWS